ncbi:MazG nucleotide pyrophosphohydrolase domain-containing protein [Nosocomiicoccus massiliensis]|uniref:MazG nucleotide pyrophosphohydrolase domain-containing protein n=1 Tax=Nosocomiicoccus massiliensis TaxID=1232430 RepID=A0AAF1BM16_9STAP|nr:MazG nucleotide pyrophosphohydrolase domain-containing protein [Nosocomiicoccus massiliensis]WOS95584.1 MazG nucleotide pyrophosphohydrolase domain-containing protein [Nosocomiicoccus massiliensis]
MITIVGLGSSDVDHMTVGVYNRLKTSDFVYLRTNDHPAVELLHTENISYKSFDNYYVESETFEETYEKIVDTLLSKGKDTDIIYAVPGSPLLYETTTELLLNNDAGVEVDVIGGQSFIDVCIEAVNIRVNEGFQILDGSTLTERDLNHRQHTLITQVYDQFSVSDVKLTLLDYYEPETPVTLIVAAGSREEKLITKPLEEIDYDVPNSNLMTMFIEKIDSETLDNRSIYHMREIYQVLVGENGCPWDKVQTHQSLERFLLEESYEVIEAIEKEDDNLLVEELGDILLQVGLHAAIAERDGYFNFHDILESLNRKIVHRHPHVFGDVEVNNQSELTEVWNAQKKKEGKTERIKYEKEYATTVLEWMKETIHSGKSLDEILEEQHETR